MTSIEKEILKLNLKIDTNCEVCDKNNPCHIMPCGHSEHELWNEGDGSLECHGYDAIHETKCIEFNEGYYKYCICDDIEFRQCLKKYSKEALK